MLRRTVRVDGHFSGNKRPGRVSPRQLLAAIGITILVIRPSAFSPAAEYVITDLGDLAGELGVSIAEDINAAGHVVGMTQTLDGYRDRAMLYDGDLSTLPISGIYSHAYAINASGQVAGYRSEAGNHMAFRYDGTAHDLGTLGGKWSIAIGINDRGLIVGYSTTSPASTSPTHAFLYDGTLRDLGTLGGANSSSWASDINNKGQVSGYFTKPNKDGIDDTKHAFFYDGTMHEIESLGGDTAALAINDNGFMTGQYQLSDGVTQHAFLYDGVMHDLGSLGGNSMGCDINSFGQIVGVSTTVPGRLQRPKAIFYDANQGLVDLNTRIDPLSGWDLHLGRAINDLGQIVGAGLKNGSSHAFLLTPLRALGDANEDQVIDAADYTVWADNHLKTTALGAKAGDFNRDGFVDGADYTRWADHFAPVRLSLAVVPEPSTLALAAIGVSALLAGKARHRPTKRV